MGKLSISKKAWLDAAPGGMKASDTTSLATAISTFKKLVPAGVDGLKSDDDCTEAAKGVAPLVAALKAGDSSVEAVSDAAKAGDKKSGAKKPSPDVAKAATARALLKGWLDELDDIKAALAARRVEIAEAVADPVLKKWAAIAKGFEKHLTSEIAQVKKVDNQLSHSEQMRQEALMAMVERAGELSETGHTGEVPADFMDDAEFKSMYKEWDTQIDVYEKNAKLREVQNAERKGFVKMLNATRAAVAEAVKTLGDTAALKSPTLKELVELNDFLADMIKQSDTGKYSGYFLMLGVDSSADQVRKDAEDVLKSEFKRIDPKAATLYFRKGFEKRGLDRRLLGKRVTEAEAILKKMKSIIGKTEEGVDLPKDIAKQLTDMRDELTEMSDSFKRGRNDMDIIQALSKDVNADEKKRIDGAGEELAAIAAEAVALLRAAKNVKIGAHR